MKILEIIEYILPVYWASYLINSDASGLEDGEQAEIDAFVDRENLGRFVDVSEPWFAKSNDANLLGGDVATYQVWSRPLNPPPPIFPVDEFDQESIECIGELAHEIN